MNGVLHYVETNRESCKQAVNSINSCLDNDWSVISLEGYTPSTYKAHPTGQRMSMIGGRLYGFYKEKQLRRAETKRACAMNHVRFWETVILEDEPMVFLEHDAIAIDPPQEWKFEHVLILNAEHAFDFGALKGKFGNWKLPKVKEVSELPYDYPLWCKVKGSPYFGAKMIPGTAAYAITPEGARLMLDAVDRLGLEQSDYMINEQNVTLEYITPSPFKFADKNLRTSHG